MIRHTSKRRFLVFWKSILHNFDFYFGRITYYPGFKTEFAQPVDFVSGTTCRNEEVGNLSAVDFGGGSLSNYSVNMTRLEGEDSWFPGVPCAVSVESGCYLAWSNATHYFEERNYILENLTYVDGCPDCTKENADGQCVSDGTPHCSSQFATYRCVATRVLECDRSMLVGSCTS